MTGMVKYWMLMGPLLTVFTLGIAYGGGNEIASTKRAELLTMLTRIQKGPRHDIGISANPTPSEKQAILEIRRIRAELAKTGGILVWDGTKWTDGRLLAIGSAGLGTSAMNVLAELNYWEQNYGSLSVPENQHGNFTDMGEATSAISSLKKRLLDAGVRVQLDKSLGIWKVQTDSR